jgi:microcystin-dependent protein
MSFYDVINSSNYSLYRSNTNQNSLQDNIPPYSMVPVGNVSAFAGVTAPVGYFLCDGSAYSRTLYSNLFNVIGTIYGVGDGLSTFNVPNLKGRFPVGLDASQTEFDVLAETGGAKTHTLTVSEMPSHTHTHNAMTGGQGQRGLCIADGTNTVTALDSSLGELNVGTTPSALMINNTGGSQAHNNLQPYIVMNYIIKF